MSIDTQLIGHTLLERGFKTFTLYLFKAIEGKRFILEKPHEEIFKTFQAIYDGKAPRTIFNLCPRSGKTTLAKYFVVYTLTQNPKSNIIYTSYSNTLLSEISQDIAYILEHPIYKSMYPNKVFVSELLESEPIDEFWKKYLIDNDHKSKYSSKLIKTYAGGTCLFSSIGSTVTGFGCGSRSSKRFSGLLICFPYKQKVWTDKGLIPIGDIVEKKLNVKILSYNFNKKQIELQPIDNYIKNPGDYILKVKLKNGISFECTPNHKVWTINRGYIEAKDLIGGIDKVVTVSNSFDLLQRQPSFIYNFISWVISISNEVKCFLWQFYFFTGFIINCFCKLLKRFTSFNSLDCADMAIKSGGDFFKTSFVFTYINYILMGKFTSRKYQCTDLDSVLHIFTFSTISKIFKSIVRGVRIKMANLHIGGASADKGKHNQAMDTKSLDLRINREIDSEMSEFISDRRSQDFLFNSISPSISCSNNPFKRFNLSHIRNLIKSLVIGDVLVDSVCCVSHVNNSFCLTVHNNHNMFVGESKGVLVKNCDDPNKIADIRSAVLRKKVHTYFSETLLSRVNSSDTPITVIQQRCNVEDLSGYLIDKYNYDVLKIPLLDNDGNCNLPSQYSPERIKELQLDNYVFQSQYQQEPIILGGEIIRREWFRYYDVNVKYKYKKIVMASDTAMSTKESADRSVVVVGGITQDNTLHIIDMIAGRWDYPTLKANIINLWNKYQLGLNETSASAFYIEEKASGIQVIQELKPKGIPVIPLKADKDKYTRVQGVLEYMASGQVYLPQSEYYGFSPEILTELESFTRDDSHLHDDIVDAVTYLIKATIARNKVSILEVL